MDVSVIIPSYNRPALLKQALESVVAQTLRPREIIVVDNGTNDDARLMVDASFGTEITVLKMQPAGVQAARNAGIARATGEWISTLDDDDLWHADYIESISLAAADGRTNLIYSNFRKFNEERGERVRYPQTNFEMAPAGYWDGVAQPGDGAIWSSAGSFPPERLLRFNAFYPSAMTIRRDFVHAIGAFNREISGIKSEDMEFTARALLRGHLALLWSPLMDYRIHGQNSCAADWVSQAIGRWKIFEYIYERDGYGSEAFRTALQEDLPVRRAKMFDQAWRHGRFAATDEIKPLLTEQDWTGIRRLRQAVRMAPSPLREAIMACRETLSNVLPS